MSAATVGVVVVTRFPSTCLRSTHFASSVSIVLRSCFAFTVRERSCAACGSVLTRTEPKRRQLAERQRSCCRQHNN